MIPRARVSYLQWSCHDGRLPKKHRQVNCEAFRNRYGFHAGKRIRLIAGDEGLTLIPEIPPRRFVKKGPILTIDTGTGTVTEDVFSVSALREAHLKDKENEDRRG